MLNKLVHENRVDIIHFEAHKPQNRNLDVSGDHFYACELEPEEFARLQNYLEQHARPNNGVTRFVTRTASELLEAREEGAASTEGALSMKVEDRALAKLLLHTEARILVSNVYEDVRGVRRARLTLDQLDITQGVTAIDRPGRVRNPEQKLIILPYVVAERSLLMDREGQLIPVNPRDRIIIRNGNIETKQAHTITHHYDVTQLPCRYRGNAPLVPLAREMYLSKLRAEAS